MDHTSQTRDINDWLIALSTEAIEIEEPTTDNNVEPQP